MLDLGNFKCGTISWLRNAGNTYVDEDTPSDKRLGDWALDLNRSEHTSSPPTRAPPHIPRPEQNKRTISGGTFQRYHEEAALQGRISNVPDFVVAEGENDINMNEGRHYFITIPMFELSRRSQTSLDLYKEASGLLPPLQIQPLIIEVNEATLGIFVSSLPDANLVVTCSTKWRPTRIKPFSDYLRDIKVTDKTRGTSTLNGNSKRRRSKPRGSGRLGDWDGDSNGSSSVDFGESNDSSDDAKSGDSETDRMILAMLQDEKPALERVKQMLKKRHSIQRHRNSNWLMHAIIDAVVDNLVPISKIYEAQLQRMSSRIFELQHRLSREEVKEMIVMKRDLEWLQHELRPFARVMRHLIDDRNIGVEVTHYLEDIEDHLLRTLEELSSFASECVALKDEYNAYRM